MGCNCKRDIIVAEKGVDIELPKGEKKGIRYYLRMVSNTFLQLLMRLFVVVLFLAVVPIVFVILVFNVIFRGKNVINIPNKWVKMMMKRAKGE